MNLRLLNAMQNEAGRKLARQILGDDDLPKSLREETWGEVDEAMLRAETWRMYSAPVGAALGVLVALLLIV